ncbi:32 kDa beta-galactoside-binding lectin-like [Thrips palmi]|uniref:Galectin n=1 Tax=Thrips palmi TaxID=161013 RepID=A0A6P8Y7C0_THRPL|nr:32 kDa beta-galactoside-binding lectin-like [Thrips palmi]
MYPSSGGFNVPFVRQLDGPFHPGRVIAFSGTIPHHASRFELNLQCGGAEPSMSDIALHVSVRFDQYCVVRNTKQGGWQHEERDGGIPGTVRPGAAFQMLVRCEPHAFKIAFNGQHFRDYRHRLPYQRVTHVSADGNIQMYSVSGVLGPCSSSTQQTHNPGVPHTQMIGSIYPGRCLRVRGFIPHNAYRFSVNLATGPSMTGDDIALHVSTRPSEGIVEINTCRRGGWENGQQHRPCPVRAGQHFEMIVMVEDYNYRIAFNGVHFAEWPHRHPYQHVRSVIVEGTVQLQLVSLEGEPRSGGYAPPPPPSFFPSPYDDPHHYPSPYPILY